MEDFRQRADRGRAAQGRMVMVLSVFGLGTGLWFLASSQVPLGVMFVLGGVGVALYGNGRISMSRQILRSAGYWQQGTGFIQFGPSRRIGAWDYLPVAVTSMGALVAVGMQLASGVESADGVWTLVLAALMLLGTVVSFATVPVGGRREPEIILTPDAVWLWTGGPKRACIPWAARPNLEASINHRMRPHVLITGGTGGSVLFPIVFVPIGHAQLQTVLRFYSSHAELRSELATGQGLQRVRAFMAAPDLVGEGAGFVVPEQVREGTVVSASDPTRPTGASPSPASSYAGEPYGGSLYGGAPYVDPSFGAVGSQAAGPGSPTPFGSAVSEPQPPPAAIGYGYGAGPSPSETAGEREPASGPRRDSGSRSSEPQSCEEADRKARRTPWHFLIWAVIVLVSSAYVISSWSTGVFLLGLVISLVLLIHAIALAGARRCRTAAHRRWTLSSEGICLRNTWFVPLAVHVEMTLLGFGSLLSVGLLAISDHADRGGVVLPFLIAMVLLVIAAFVGLGTPLSRRGSEIVLDSERIRSAAGTRRESLFWWADRPRVVGVGSDGTVLMDAGAMGRIPARLDTRPLTYVQLERVVAFYSSHPELRWELVTEEGLMRVQGLTGPELGHF